MVYVQTRTATAGELITGTFSVIAAARREVGLYLLVFGGLGLFLGFDLIEGPVSLFSFFFYFAAQYWLCRQMLVRTGLGHNDRFRVFSLFFMAILLGLAISFGFNFFWIPGILLGSKWVMAPAFLAAGDDDLFKAIGASWRASDGNTLSLSLAYSAIGLIGLAVLWSVIMVGSTTDRLANASGAFVGGPIEGMFLSLSLNVLPILLMALSVAAYRMLSDNTDQLAEVFA